jgi:parallel beta-helix repeat protein
MLAGLIAGLLTAGAAQAEAPQPSTITLGDNGWSWPAGTWDPATRTAVLTQDLKATIRIAGNGITLDGNGYKTVGNGAGDGVYLLGRTGVTIKNLKVKKFTNGIQVRLGGGNTLTGITAENNNIGICVINSTGNTVADNVADNNSYQGILVQGAAGNSVTGNSACGNIFGIWLAGSGENTLAGNTASGNGGCGFWLMGSANNTLAENTANGNIVFGMHLQGCNGNTLTGNTVNDNAGGIRAMGSQNNNFTNNTVVNSGTGIYLQGCGGHVISGNTLEGNKVYGINFLNAGGSTISGNTVSGNGCGLYFWNSSNNEVFNNNFIDNTVQARAGIGSGNVFDLPKPVGGNYWSGWTGPDADGDGFVDNPYVVDRPNRLFYGQDNLPWTTENGWLASTAVRYEFIGFLPPMDNDGGSTFKLGSTVPVKFQLVDADQNPVTDANTRLYLSKITDGVVGEETEAVSNGKAGDNFFRYAAEDEQYILNLVTRDLSEGTWRLRADIGDGTSRYVMITLRGR